VELASRESNGDCMQPAGLTGNFIEWKSALVVVVGHSCSLGCVLISEWAREQLDYYYVI